MAFWDAVGQSHVCQAVAEYDRLGQDEFLAHYGFGRARAYLLIVDGKSYDSKAILGVAFRLATGRPRARQTSAEAPRVRQRYFGPWVSRCAT